MNIFVFQVLMAFAVLHTSTPTGPESFAELSGTIKRLFKVFAFKQVEILENLAEINENVKKIDSSPDSCEGTLEKWTAALDQLDLAGQFCRESTDTLDSFKDVLHDDECSNGQHNCHANAACTNLLVGFSCACKEGYNGDGLQCTDENECQTGTHRCHSQATCSNRIGSYSCACKPGFYGDGKSCTARKTCSSDRDCSSTSRCKTDGSRKYCFCAEGYQRFGQICGDVNECIKGQHSCHAKATCSNTQGSYACSCSLGYTGDGRSCNDLNECNGDNECHGNGICTNNLGSYTCACKPGFRGDGYNCKDVDECAEGNFICLPNSKCQNTVGNYSCVCDAGYQGDGRVSCEDENECLGVNTCHADATCSNNVGSYSCACKPGFSGDGNQCTDLCPFERIARGECIFIQKESMQTWEDARDVCQDEGGQLFTATSPGALERLQQYLINTKTRDVIPDWTALWIGVESHQWLGGRAVSQEEWNFDHCPSSEDCCGALLSGTAKYGLNSDPCTWARFSICQWNGAVV